MNFHRDASAARQSDNIGVAATASEGTARNPLRIVNALRASSKRRTMPVSATVSGIYWRVSSRKARSRNYSNQKSPLIDQRKFIIDLVRELCVGDSVRFTNDLLRWATIDGQSCADDVLCEMPNWGRNYSFLNTGIITSFRNNGFSLETAAPETTQTQ